MFNSVLVSKRRGQLVYMEWTDERVFALIEHYEKSECVYIMLYYHYYRYHLPAKFVTVSDTRRLAPENWRVCHH